MSIENTNLTNKSGGNPCLTPPVTPLMGGLKALVSSMDNFCWEVFGTYKGT